MSPFLVDFGTFIASFIAMACAPHRRYVGDRLEVLYLRTKRQKMSLFRRASCGLFFVPACDLLLLVFLFMSGPDRVTSCSLVDFGGSTVHRVVPISSESKTWLSAFR